MKSTSYGSVIWTFMKKLKVKVTIFLFKLKNIDILYLQIFDRLSSNPMFSVHYAYAAAYQKVTEPKTKLYNWIGKCGGWTFGVHRKGEAWTTDKQYKYIKIKNTNKQSKMASNILIA
jgi:hypothetical protein